VQPRRGRGPAQREPSSPTALCGGGELHLASEDECLQADQIRGARRECRLVEPFGEAEIPTAAIPPPPNHVGLRALDVRSLAAIQCGCHLTATSHAAATDLAPSWSH